MKIIAIFLFAVLAMALPSQMVFADTQIPFWIRESFKWWALDKIPQDKVETAASWLAAKDDFTVKTSGSHVPSWLKNVAMWWADDSISDQEVLANISYLSQNGMITISSKNQYDQDNYTEYDSDADSSLFRTFAYKKDFIYKDGGWIATQVQFELKDNPAKALETVKSDGKSVVVLPIFTATAYSEPGFYTHYRGECDESCLEKKIAYGEPYSYSGSANAIKVLRLLGYDLITDIDIDKNPKILSNYDKVIMLHNEYVTQKEFDAVTSQPKVIYLYPNALYAKITADYNTNTIKLIRGHEYPSKDIRNGFGWKYDNSPHEYDQCKSWQFNDAGNGIMLSCFPEYIIMNDFDLLKKLADY